MQTVRISLDERYLNEARRLGLIGDVSEFFNKTLKDFVEAKKAEMEKQQILAGLREAVADVKNNRVSKIDTLWNSIDD
jgi:phenylpyruvate tautomerase PptA (4-oxalocrotonate tautomerase family)